MALVEVKVPQLSESVAEATLLGWHKQAGDLVQRDENLIDIETDKVVLEVPAPEAGVLAQVLKQQGATVVSGEVIAMINTDVKTDINTDAKAATSSGPAATVASAGAAPGTRAGVAMPAAAKLIAEQGLNPAHLAGTGRDGRITKADVLGAAAAATAQPAPAPLPSATPQGLAALPPVAPQSPAPVPAPASQGAVPAALPQVAAPADLASLTQGRPEQRVPMSRLRARVAERLLQSQASNAILTTFNEVNMQPAMDLRKRYAERFEKDHGVKLGFMSFFVKAAVHALKKYPIVNASVDGSDIVYHGYFDVGVAVGSPRGLVVPVIRNADQLGFSQIEKTIADFGKRAQAGKLGIEELSGGTFSISNGGVFGSMLSTPIINPPQSAILGVHATKERPVVENGQIVIRPMNYLAVSYDHRIIDGRDAVLFLVSIKEALEDPARLLLDL
ncbi:MAG: 2-oxoglutarate dehydrogenase complex dihydrolipoyllysine-residue succinyltransferase [Betaproteobacteria bacterium]|nr:2-oxoglutarate dehydrogenase complex dihydrolipoyllysine-residue succinyltransferase [Betaproteobacteria bacterium]